jgi:hypothetical protein
VGESVASDTTPKESEMAHLTAIPESASEVVDLEAHALGFTTKGMGDCALIVVLWNRHGSIYKAGRGQHCSGGLPAAQLDALFLNAGADATVFLVLGTVEHPADGIDAEYRCRLERRCSGGNWPLEVLQGIPHHSVMTHTGKFLPKSDYDKQELANAAENQSCGRCCIIM